MARCLTGSYDEAGTESEKDYEPTSSDHVVRAWSGFRTRSARSPLKIVLPCA